MLQILRVVEKMTEHYDIHKVTFLKVNIYAEEVDRVEVGEKFWGGLVGMDS